MANAKKNMKKILNATAHEITHEQKMELAEIYGVDFILVSTRLAGMDNQIIDYLRSTPFQYKYDDTYQDVASFFKKYDAVILPCGSPALAWRIAQEFYFTTENRTQILFAYSERVSQEVALPNGSVEKISTFAHKGFQIL